MFAVLAPTSRRSQRSTASTYLCPLRCEPSGPSRPPRPVCFSGFGFVSVIMFRKRCFLHSSHAASGKHILCDKPVACRSPPFQSNAMAHFFSQFHLLIRERECGMYHLCWSFSAPHPSAQLSRAKPNHRRLRRFRRAGQRRIDRSCLYSYSYFG